MKSETGTLLLLGAAHSLNHSIFLVLPPLLSTIATGLGVSFQELGYVATLTFFTYGTGALIGGPLSDTIGSIKVARISIGLAGLSSLLFFICRDLTVFTVAMLLMAIWASFYHPTANGLIAKAFPNKTGNAMGMHNAAGNLGQVATPTVAFFIGIMFDWRYSFIFFGVLSVAVSLLMGNIKLDEGERLTGKLPLMEFLKVREMRLPLIFNMVVGFLFRGVEVFFPTFLRVGRGFSGETAAYLGSMILLFGTAGQLIGGRGADKYGATRVLLFSSFGILGSLLLLMLAPASLPLAVLFTLIYGVSVFAHQPSMTSLVSKVTPRPLMGLSYGIMFFFSFGLGSISAAVLGYVTDAYNINTAFWLNAVAAAILVFITLLIKRDLNRSSDAGFVQNS